MAYMLGRCVAQGRRAGILAALGFNSSSYFYLTTAVLGLSAVLAASTIAFNVIRWMGAAYLIYLGIDAIRSKGGLAIDGDSNARKDASIFWQAFITDILNPKVVMFFFAFLPQFVDARKACDATTVVAGRYRKYGLSFDQSRARRLFSETH